MRGAQHEVTDHRVTGLTHSARPNNDSNDRRSHPVVVEVTLVLARHGTHPTDAVVGSSHRRSRVLGNDEPVDGERFWRVTVDVNVLGTLYNSPFRIQACEENAGKSNTSTVRIESNGVFVVQRVRRGGRDCDRLVETSPYPYAGGDCRRARTLWKAVQRNRPPLGGLGCLRLRDPLNRGGSHEPWVG